jgi:hypothetical protein
MLPPKSAHQTKPKTNTPPGPVFGTRSVSRARLKRHFGDDALRQLDLEWKEEQKSRNKKPADLVKYARLIRDACYYESLSERYYSRGAFNKQICNKAEGLFDAAFARLREAIQLDGSLSGWLDRGIEEASPCAAGAPRRRSLEKQLRAPA